MNKTTLNSQKEKHSMLSLQRATMALPAVLKLYSNFYPRSPCGERQQAPDDTNNATSISIHALLAKSDPCMCSMAPVTFSYFYPRSPCGERLESNRSHILLKVFLSTLSLRRATAPLADGAQADAAFLSTLSLRRATARGPLRARAPEISIHALLAESDVCGAEYPSPGGISIHALLAESDGHAAIAAVVVQNFYPRSPCGERHALALPDRAGIIISIHALLAESDGFHHDCVCSCVVFLSTLSLRRATVDTGRKRIILDYFYPRSPCGERLLYLRHGGILAHFYPRSPCGERPARCSPVRPGSPISIHALLAESDLAPQLGLAFECNFYPRSPCGERPWGGDTVKTIQKISIHALLAESDQPAQPDVAPSRYFYPRSPCGERPPQTRRALQGRSISIHALLAESDSLIFGSFLHKREFLSTLSLRRATALALPDRAGIIISIHALLAESDLGAQAQLIAAPVFLSTLSLRRATVCQFAGDLVHQFLSTLSLRRATAAAAVSSTITSFLSTLSLRRATGHPPLRSGVAAISIHALLAESDFVTPARRRRT